MASKKSPTYSRAGRGSASAARPPGPAGVYSVERVLKGTAGRRLPAAEIKNGGKHQPRQQPLLVRDEGADAGEDTGALLKTDQLEA